MYKFYLEIINYKYILYIAIQNLGFKMNKMSFEEFMNKYKDQLNDFAFLFGNGFPMSHPREGVRECFVLSKEDLKDIVNKIPNYFKPFFENDSADNDICPETSLNFIRIIYGIETFKRYQEKQKNSLKELRPTKFLERFKAIYTTNYDLFSYYSIFPPYPDKTKFTDGFDARNELSGAKIGMRLNENKDKIPFYFLHGAYHLYVDNNGNYGKYRNKYNNKDFSDELLKIYDKLLDESKLNPFHMPEKNPLLIFSSRSCYKNGAVEKGKYFSLCMERLSSEVKILTFGCSFKIDKHILDSILIKSQNKHVQRELFVGYYSDDDEKIITDYLNKNNINEKGEINNVKVSLVCMKENDDNNFIKNEIWDDKKKIELDPW